MAGAASMDDANSAAAVMRVTAVRTGFMASLPLLDRRDATSHRVESGADQYAPKSKGVNLSEDKVLLFVRRTVAT